MDSILIIRLGRLGDVLLTSSTVKNLRFLYPDSKMIFVTRSAYLPIMKMFPAIDATLTFPDNGSYLDLMKLSTEIDEYQPQLIVDLHKNFRSFHLANLSKAPYKVVYKKRRKEREGAVNDKNFVEPVPHTTDLYNLVIDQLKGERISRRPDLFLPEKYLIGPKAIRDSVAIVPGASSAVKAWPTERFAELAERIISDYNLPVSLFLGPGDEAMADHFSKLPTEKVSIYNNLDLAELACRLSQAKLTITNDSGLMHVSSAVGTPTAAIFGPTHKQLGFYPLGLFDRVLETDEKCRPCSLHGNKECYREQQYCFTRLTVDLVYQEISTILDDLDLKPALFIDRDGTLIVDKNYLADPDKIEFFPGVLEKLALAKRAGYKIVVISNQSGVARGFFPTTAVEAVNSRLAEEMAKHDCGPDAIRYCPHLPDGDLPEFTSVCDCRKPQAGMIETAALELGIDVKRSFVIGDKQSDIICGHNVGGMPILVRTGKGAESEIKLPQHKSLLPYLISDCLTEAIETILSRQ